MSDTNTVDGESSQSLLAEQRAYYRAIAGEYEEHAIPGWHGDTLERALDAFSPTGRVLELACGTGAWTRLLLRHAHSLTALDAAPEMLAIARARVGHERVRFVEADIFTWWPDRRYDAVVFAFWLSHVPPDRFEQFWELVDCCLRPGGRVFFVDDARRTAEELPEGEAGATVIRCLKDGSAHRLVKVAHTPVQLERSLEALGWNVRVTEPEGAFFCGQGGRA